MWLILPSLGPPSLEFVTTYTHMKVDINGGLEHFLDLENACELSLHCQQTKFSSQKSNITRERK
jgi:hypothetical protein